ncbi:MAG TPA: AAA family ATPase [Abditibacteriaceae bacterium]|jgi:MoxR-like ATPase
MEKLRAEEAIEVRDAARAVVAHIERVLVGKRETVEKLVTSLFARGHVLIEDIPGVGKTTLAKAIATTVGGSFKRIQFTPDLLPGDVTGLTAYDPRSGEWSFKPGPVFANVVLADEINRATPKTQSALLESMEESQVTTDGITRALPRPFFVVATQNPVEYRGTYPLPEAQMDRFLMRLHLGYPQPAEEVEMLARHGAGIQVQPNSTVPRVIGAETKSEESAPVLTAERAQHIQDLVSRVHVSQAVREYIVALAHGTRGQYEVALGISPRGSLALQRAAQSAAAIAGREFVTPDDVKRLALPVLAHRLLMSGDAGRGHTAAESLLQRLLHEIPIPAMPR